MITPNKLRFSLVPHVVAPARRFGTTGATVKSNAGFTLIEMMVAVTIFSIVMLVSVGSILAIVEANRKAQSLKSVVNNLNFTMETISRNIRVGTKFHCFSVNNNAAVPDGITDPQDCDEDDEANALALEPQLGDPNLDTDQVIYRFNNGAIWRQISPGPFNDAVRLTADEVTIEHMEFVVDGNTVSASGDQPRVRITIQGFAEVGSERTDFNLQTTVTQRVLDLPAP